MGQRWANVWANVGPTLDQSPIQTLGQRWANIGSSTHRYVGPTLGQRCTINKKFQ